MYVAREAHVLGKIKLWLPTALTISAHFPSLTLSTEVIRLYLKQLGLLFLVAGPKHCNSLPIFAGIGVNPGGRDPPDFG